MVTIGSSGSGVAAATSQAVAVGATTSRPGGHGDALQLGQDVAEGLGVHAVAAGPAADGSERGGVRPVETGGGEDRVEHDVDLVAQRCADRGGARQRSVSRAEQLVDERPQAIERGLHPLLRQVGAVAEPDDPLRGVVAVVGSSCTPLAAIAARTGSGGRQAARTAPAARC